MRYLLIALLFLTSPVLGEVVDVHGDLIDAPGSAKKGQEIRVIVQGSLPYTVENGIRVQSSTTNEGNTQIFITVGDKDITISVSHQIAHPTAKEIESAPLDNREKFLEEWLPKHNRDEIYQDSHTVKVGDGPDPPGPDPDPPGPDPDPDPDDPAPIPEPGFRVMILKDDKQNLPQLQQAILVGAEVDAYLRKACIEEPGGTAGFRIYDKDADLSSELKVWKDAIQRRPESTPWVIVSNGKTGYEGPLPESPSKFIELCEKYRGPNALQK